MLDSLPRTDVSKEMCNSKLLAKLTDKNWKVKKEGYDKVDDILAKANNRIEKNGLKDLVTKVPQHAQLHSFNSNPYSPRHNVYYVS